MLGGGEERQEGEEKKEGRERERKRGRENILSFTVLLYLKLTNYLIFVILPSRWKKLSKQESCRGDSKELLRDHIL